MEWKRWAQGKPSSQFCRQPLFLVACGASGTQRATIDSAPPPRPAEAAVATADSTPPRSAPERTATEVTGNPTPSAREYPAAVRIGARVADVRTDPALLEVQVGDSLSMTEDVDLVAYDADGNRVPGVRILANIDSRHLVMENGYLKGLSEGEAALQLAIRAPPTSGRGDPEIKTFSSPVRVVGPPVVGLEIVPPDVALLTGAVVPLKVRAETESGLRENVEVEWSSNRRRLATVDSRGFLSALLPGEVTITAEVEGIEATIALEVIDNPVVTVQVGCVRFRGPHRGRDPVQCVGP